VENAWVLKTIDINLQAIWANPRFISSYQGKNAMLWVAFSIGKFQLKLKCVCQKNVEMACVNRVPVNRPLHVKNMSKEFQDNYKLSQ